jgi:nucleotide-binding universal stress UspA family protein
VVSTICERARWADLIVMYPATPPGSGVMSRLSSGSRGVIYGSCRPILTVPTPVSSAPERVLLAFDGGTKAREGLFVAAHLANEWQVALDVINVVEQGSQSTALEQAQQYLETHEIKGNYLAPQGDVAEKILEVAEAQQGDLIIMGGYGVKPLREVLLGSKVDRLVTESQLPILVCR